jgi:choline dehydrogenase
MLNKGLKAIAIASLASLVQAVPLFGSSFGIPGDNATYDYVVVGGGNAGLTIATRLVQQKAGTVAIIEAGTFYEISNGNISQIPATGSYFSGKNASDWQPQIDWGYATTPQIVSREKHRG